MNNGIELIRKYATEWNLGLEDEPFVTPSSVLHYAMYANQPAVLKIFKPNSDERNSAAILTQYDGQGAVKVYKTSQDAVLLERAMPGGCLAELVLEGKDDQATAIFCQVASQLHAAKYQNEGIEPVAALARAFKRYKITSDQAIPAATLKRAEAMYAELCSTQTNPVLLHGDLHHDNILHDAKRGWLCIDPKGYIGEAEFEAAAFLKNPRDDRYYASEDIIQRRIDMIASTMQLDAKRILLWSFSYYVISTIWGIEDGDFKAEWLTMLRILEKMIC